MRILLCFVFLFMPLLSNAGDNESLVQECEILTLGKERYSKEPSIAPHIEEQKAKCKKDPQYEICVYKGAKEFTDRGALPRVEHTEAIMKNCKMQSNKPLEPTR